MKSILVVFFLISGSAWAVSASLKSPVMHEHGPFASGRCEVCHVTDATGNLAPPDLVLKQPDLCYQCHERKDAGKFVHGALSSFGCTDCHSPHESEQRFMLISPIRELCVNCHSAQGVNEAHPHSAVTMGMGCVRCHASHSSDYPALQRRDVTETCISCHRDFKEKLSNRALNVHAAMPQGCNACHVPHGSKQPRLLGAEVTELCFKCHEKKAFAEGHPRRGHRYQAAADPIYPDKPFNCLPCHKPHFSRQKKLIRYNTTAGITPYDGTVCSVCHWQAILPAEPPRPAWDD